MDQAVKLADLLAIHLAELAGAIVERASWRFLGLCFEEKYEIIITERKLKTANNGANDQQLCHDLLTALADGEVLIEDLAIALESELIGMKNIAAQIRKNKYRKNSAPLTKSATSSNPQSLPCAANKFLIVMSTEKELQVQLDLILQSRGFSKNLPKQQFTLWRYENPIVYDVYVLSFQLGDPSKTLRFSQILAYANDILCVVCSPDKVLSLDDVPEGTVEQPIRSCFVALKEDINSLPPAIRRGVFGYQSAALPKLKDDISIYNWPIRNTDKRSESIYLILKLSNQPKDLELANRQSAQIMAECSTLDVKARGYCLGCTELYISGPSILPALVLLQQEEIIQKLALKDLHVVTIQKVGVRGVIKAMQKPENAPFKEVLYKLISDMAQDNIPLSVDNRLIISVERLESAKQPKTNKVRTNKQATEIPANAASSWELELRNRCHNILEEEEFQGVSLLSKLGIEISKRFPQSYQQMKDKGKKLVAVLQTDERFIIEGTGGFTSARLKVKDEQHVIAYVHNRLKNEKEHFIRLSALGNEITQRFPNFYPQDQGYKSFKDFISKAHRDFQIKGDAGLVGVYLQSSEATSATYIPVNKSSLNTPPLNRSRDSSSKLINEKDVVFGKKHDVRTENAKIYLKNATFNSEPCVVKKLLVETGDPAEAEKIQREVDIQAKFSDHENICPLRGYFIKNEKLYLVMPLMKCSLRQEIEVNGRLPLAKVIRIAYGIARGVNHLHMSQPSLKTMHRDLNASNVLLDDHGAPKISDFGFARTASEATKAFTVNKGTTASIAPEMIDPAATEKEYTEKVDVWGFAMILYEMLSGERPYAKLNVVGLGQLFGEEAKTGIIKRPPIESITNNDNVFSKRLIALMQQCWQLEPKNRPDFKTILEALTPLKKAVEEPYPVPEFWNLQQKLDLIGYVGDRYVQLIQHNPTVALLEANQHSITGGDWTALFEEEVLEILDHQILPDDRASVVKLIREISNIKRHMKDKKSTQLTMETFAKKVDQSFPRLVHHLFIAVKVYHHDILDIIFPKAY